MNKTTTNDLIRYLFNETELTDTVIIQHEIDHNYFVNEEFEELKETLQLMDEILIAPSKDSINAIFSYSMLSSQLKVS